MIDSRQATRDCPQRTANETTRSSTLTPPLPRRDPHGVRNHVLTSALWREEGRLASRGVKWGAVETHGPCKQERALIVHSLRRFAIRTQPSFVSRNPVRPKIGCQTLRRGVRIAPADVGVGPDQIGGVARQPGLPGRRVQGWSRTGIASASAADRKASGSCP